MPPLKSRRMVRGRQQYPYTHARFTCIQIGLLLKLCMRMRVDLCRRRPRIVAAPNGALKYKIPPQRDFKAIR